MAVATGTALAIGAVAGMAGSYLSSNRAASAQENAANQSNATLQGQYAQTRADQMPWMQRGNAAGNQMAYLMGLPGYGPSNGGSLGSAMSSGITPRQRPEGISENDWAAYGPMADAGGGWSDGWGGSTQQPMNQFNSAMGGFGSLSTPFSQTNWQQDPGYAFRLSEGQKALERSGAAKGMSLSGAQQKALMGYGQGMASQEYQNAYNRYGNDQNNLYNRLAGIAGTGQQANQFTASLGSNMANGVANTQASLGNAQAANYLSMGNAFSGAVNQGLNSWNNQNNWNSLMDQQNAGSAGTAYGNWMAQNAGRYGG